MDRNAKMGLWALSTVPLVMTLGNSMLIPVLPLIEKKLRITDFQVSLVITVYSVVAIILIPIAGYLSDKWGRKKVIIPSLCIAAIGGAITGWVSWKLEDPYVWILIGRIIQGIGSAGAMPVVIPCVGDMFTDEKEVSRGLGLVETSNTLGKVISPILGSFLASFVWFLPFWFIPILCLISITFILLFVKPPKQEKEAPPLHIFLQNIKSILQEKGRWLFPVFILGGIIMFILFGTLFYLSSVLEKRYHLEGVWKGAVLAIPLASLSLTSYITGKKIGDEKTIMKWCICIGFLLLGITLVIPIFFKNIYVIIISLAISGIGIGAALPSLDALVTEGVEKEQRGSITSLYSSMRFVGVAAGPPLFAVLMRGPDNYIFYLSIFCALFGSVLALIFIKPEYGNQGAKETH